MIEAARLDGAGEWALFRRIKVPMIRGATGVAILLCVTGGFQGFDLFFVLTNGGPYGATEIPTTLLVKTVFRNGEVGYGSAMAVLLTAIVVGVGLVYVRAPGSGRSRRSGGRRGPGRGAVSSAAAGRRRPAIECRGPDRAGWPGRHGRCWRCVFFFPMVWMVLSSFKTNRAIFASPFALPESFDLSRWVEAWEVGHIGQYALNSAIVTGASVIAILLIGAARRLRLQPLPVPRARAGHGPVRPGPAAAAAVLLHRPVQHVHRSWTSPTRAGR